MKNKQKPVSVFSPNIEKRATDADLRVLDAALKAWMSWGEIVAAVATRISPTAANGAT